MIKNSLQRFRIAEKKLGKKITHRANTVNLTRRFRMKDLGNGFGRFVIGTFTLAPFSARTTTVNGNDFNLISGTWLFSGTQQGYMLNSYSSAEDRWIFTAWNPTAFTRTVTYTVIAKRKV